MLVLFDVDGTLLLTHRAGLYAMEEAAKELFGDGFSIQGVEFAGRLDPLIWSSAAEKNGVPDTPENHDRFRKAYRECLRRRFEANPTAALLPGVSNLIDALQAEDAVTLGLLTGNYPETGRMKIEAAGLDPAIFPVQAWGDEGASRRDLPGVAIERDAAQRGRRLDPREVVVIGDTPHDVDCAHANGCIALAVATGPNHARDDLLEHGPELAVDDLSDTERLVTWLLEVPAAVSE